MKAPANFDRQWHYMIKDEARRVAHEIVNHIFLYGDSREYIKVELDDEISSNMSTQDLEQFLGYFNCEGLYLSILQGKDTYIVTVRSNLVKLNILAPVHKVKPIRIHKSHKV